MTLQDLSLQNSAKTVACLVIPDMALQCINLGLGLGFGIDLSLCGVLDGGVGLGLGVKPLCLGVKQLSGWADSCPPFIVHYLHFNSIHHHS